MEKDNQNYKDNVSVTVNGSVNGGRKQQANFNENQTKLQTIEQLKLCNYRTPPRKIAFYLEQLLGRWEVNPGIWLNVAQYHHPKTINSVIYQMTKAFRRGDKTFINPAGYFVATIKHKPNRKSLKASNGGRKHQKQN